MRAVRGFVVFTARSTHCLRRDSPGAGDKGDFGGHISTEPRINDRIRVPEVRLVGPSGEQVGIVSITDALRLAQESDLDLVEVAPTARPPVCKLMDFGKFKYESALKARESRKNQTQTVIKEIKIRPKIDPHDYGTKKGHVERFLRQGDKVKVTIMFRGREQSRPELGYKLLQRLAGDVEELGFVESQPKQDGRNMIMVIGPHKKKADAKAVRTPDRASARAAAPGHQGGLEGEAGSVATRPAAPRPVMTAPAASARSASSASLDSASAGSSGEGSSGTGSDGTGSAGSGSAGEGSSGTGSDGTGSASSGSAGTGSDGTGSASTGSEPNGSAATRPAARPASSGSSGTGSSTGSAGTGSSGTGSARPAPVSARPAQTSPRPAPAPRPGPPRPGPTSGSGSARPAPRPAAPSPA
ncbi:MAG: translation initiation factor IF-3, partial [Streptosporangiaceae bacterium]